MAAGAAIANLRAMLDRESYQRTNPLNLRHVDGGSGWENHHALRELFGFRQQQSGVRIERAENFHLVQPGMEITAGQHVFGPEQIDDLIAGDARLRFIDFGDDVLEITLLARIILNGAQAGDSIESRPVLFVIPLVDLDETKLSRPVRPMAPETSHIFPFVPGWMTLS